MVINKKKYSRKPANRLKSTIKPVIRKRKLIRRARDFVPGIEYGTAIEHIDEPIDFEPLPERQFGLSSHVQPKSYEDKSLFVTVHKEDYQMAEQQGLNKMGGMASINCSQHYTRACVDKHLKAKIHNRKIDDAKRLLTRLQNKQNKSQEEYEKIEELEKYIKKSRYNVCGYCYAELGEKGLKKKVGIKYQGQGAILRSHILDKDEIPTFNPGEVIRINSHGDIEEGEQGIIQFINYLNIAYRNPKTYFTLWTKQGKVINDTYARIGFRKPPNMTFIWSNTWIDKPELRPPQPYDYFDGVFNVVKFDYYEDNKDTLFGVKIDKPTGRRVEVVKCMRFCQQCKTCYSGQTNFAIIEVLKDDARRHHEEIYARKTSVKKRKTFRPRKINPQKYIPMGFKFKA
jgi:hypothetical protein